MGGLGGGGKSKGIGERERESAVVAVAVVLSRPRSLSLSFSPSLQRRKGGKEERRRLTCNRPAHVRAVPVVVGAIAHAGAGPKRGAERAVELALELDVFVLAARVDHRAAHGKGGGSRRACNQLPCLRRTDGRHTPQAWARRARGAFAGDRKRAQQAILFDQAHACLRDRRGDGLRDQRARGRGGSSGGGGGGTTTTRHTRTLHSCADRERSGRGTRCIAVTCAQDDHAASDALDKLQSSARCDCAARASVVAVGRVDQDDQAVGFGEWGLCVERGLEGGKGELGVSAF